MKTASGGSTWMTESTDKSSKEDLPKEDINEVARSRFSEKIYILLTMH